MRRASIFATLAAAGALLSGSWAHAQQCPNPPVGPLQGTTAEFCLTQAEANNVDYTQPVFLTTTIGPLTTVPFNGTGTVAHTRWRNPTCVAILCEAAAQQPNDPNSPPLDGSSSAGFTMGSASMCTAIVTQEFCVWLSTQGQAAAAAATAACPVPPMPPGGGGPPAQSMVATCPCPTSTGFIGECTEIVVPVTATISGTSNFIDCTDFANWTDLSGAPQQKSCFNVRQRCITGTISGPINCDVANAIVMHPLFNCGHPVLIPGDADPVNGGPANVNPDDPGDLFDPPGDGQAG